MKTIKQVIGIDVSMNTFHACLGADNEGPKMRVLSQREFSNNAAGFKQLMEWTEKSMIKGLTCSFVMEATGVYYEHLAYFLCGKEQTISVLLPNKAKHFAKSLDIKTKTDKVDAAMLCRIGLERTLPAWQLPSPMMKQIKALCREYTSLKQQAVRIKVRLHAYKHSFEPDPQSIKRLKKQLILIVQQNKEVEKEIRQYVKQDEKLSERVKNIEKVKGIGFITVITVISETNGFACIENAKQLSSYCGLDVVISQSGKHSGRTRISKKGNSYIRAALYMPAMSAMRSNIRLKQFYNQIMSTHCSGKIGIIAVERKMLILIYSLWKNNTIYDPNRNVKIT